MARMTERIKPRAGRCSRCNGRVVVVETLSDEIRSGATVVIQRDPIHADDTDSMSPDGVDEACPRGR